MLIKKNTPFIWYDTIYVLVDRMKIKNNYIYFFVFCEPWFNDFTGYWVSDNNHILEVINEFEYMNSIDQILYYNQLSYMKKVISSNYIKNFNMRGYYDVF